MTSINQRTCGNCPVGQRPVLDGVSTKILMRFLLVDITGVVELYFVRSCDVLIFIDKEDTDRKW